MATFFENQKLSRDQKRSLKQIGMMAHQAKRKQNFERVLQLVEEGLQKGMSHRPLSGMLFWLYAPLSNGVMLVDMASRISKIAESEDAHVEVRKMAITLLGQIPESESRQALRRLVDCDTPKLKQLAERSLNDLRN